MTETVKIGISRIVSSIDRYCGNHEFIVNTMLEELEDDDLFDYLKPIKITISQDTGIEK